jgi:ribonucleoside-diphosphate reductase alpha chain
MKEIEPRERMKVTSGPIYKETLGEQCGSLYVIIGSDNKGICEVFTIKGKSGGCINSLLESIGRLASLALSSGIPPRHVIKQLKGIRCPHAKPTAEGALFSCPDTIAKTLERYVNREHPIVDMVAGKEPLRLETTEVEAIEKLKNIEETDQTEIPTEKKIESAVRSGENPECPKCGSQVQMEGRCFTCRLCGWSKCL